MIKNHETLKENIALLRTHKRYSDEYNKLYPIVAHQVCELAAPYFAKQHTFVRMLNINDVIVGKEAAKHCVYLNGKYVGLIYVDANGNVYGSPAEVKEALGDDIIYFSDNSLRHIEVDYCEEEDCLVAISYRINFRWYSQYDSNPTPITDYKGLLDIQEPEYYYIDKEMNVISSVNHYCTTLDALSSYDCAKPLGMMKAIKKLWGLSTGVVNVGGNTYIPLDCVDNIKQYQNYKAKLMHKPGKIQNKIDELVAMRSFDSEAINCRMPHEYENLCSKTVINRIADDVAVIRWVYNYKDETFDGMRVYIEGKDVYACKKNNQGQFVRVALSTLNQKNFSSEYGDDIEIDDMTGTRLQYYASVIHSIPKDLQITMLILFLTDVRVEQMIKAGLGPSVYALLTENKTNLATTMKNIVVVNEEGKNINQYLGVNKYQMNKIVAFCEKNEHPQHVLMMIGYMKKLFFCGNHMLNEDNAVFDSALTAYSGWYEKYVYSKGNSGALDPNSHWGVIYPGAVHEIVKEFIGNDIGTVLERNVIKYLPTFFNMTKCSYSQWNTYHDYLNMVKKMNIRQHVKLYPATEPELIQLHNDAAAAYNIHKSEYKRAAFIQALSKVEKMEYEHEDHDFCVVIPKGPEDLVVEGVQLSHCVKSYIDRVSEGRTNIVFIRKKEEPWKPFFTVEVTNDRVVAQVHGLANRNADTEPGMLEFVHQWAKSKRLRIGAINSCH